MYQIFPGYIRLTIYVGSTGLYLVMHWSFPGPDKDLSLLAGFSQRRFGEKTGGSQRSSEPLPGRALHPMVQEFLWDRQ